MIRLVKTMGNRSKKHNIIRNNKGSALIVCIIVLLFVSILATVILYISGINYRMKKAEYNTKYSFYAAEEPLERIQSNMILPVSEALNDAFVTTNSVYSADGSFDAKRREFYVQFAKSYKDLLIENYGGSSIGSDGSTLTGPAVVRNIVYNLAAGDNTWGEYNDGHYLTHDGTSVSDIKVENIFVNGAVLRAGDPAIGGIGYTNDPYGFVDWLCTHNDPATAPDFKPYIDVNGSEDLKVYIVVSDFIPETLSAQEGYDRFVMLNVTDPEIDGGAFDNAVYPTRTLKPVDDPNRTDKPCIVMRNIAVVAVHNGYRSIVCTDISFQFPPFDWNGGASTSGYNQWNVYQLIYYTNWQRY